MASPARKVFGAFDKRARGCIKRGLLDRVVYCLYTAYCGDPTVSTPWMGYNLRQKRCWDLTAVKREKFAKNKKNTSKERLSLLLFIV